METRRLIRSLLAATLLWSASVYGEKYVAPSSAELDTNADDWTVELRCANSKPCAAWVRRVGSRLHVFPLDADKDGAHQSDTRIYTFAFVDVENPLPWE